jgi:hypothetical protein
MATKKATDKKAPGKNVAAKTTDAPKRDALPATMGADFAKYSGAGMESADRDSFAIPFLAIMQKGSPQVDKDDDAHVEDAEVGDLLLTSSSEVFKDEDGVDLVYCGYRRVFLRWADDKTGGGFKGEMPVEVVTHERATGAIREQDGKLFGSNGDLIRDTRVHYVLVVRPDGTAVQAVQSFSSTQIKKSKMLMTQLQSYVAKADNGSSYTPPMFAHIFHAETIAESNDKGSWRGWKITRKGYIEDADLFNAAARFYEAVKGDGVKVDYNAVAATQPDDSKM